jgi:ligand-binding sensor domain-containing protein/DNA-binding response OmpR family regulator
MGLSPGVLLEANKIALPENLVSVIRKHIMLNWLSAPVAKLTLLIIYLVSVSPGLSAQEGQPFFKHLTAENGLSNNWVKSILKDKDGFMWFGTFNGLNRYDGSDFKLFRAGDNTALGDNIIECLAEDQQGNIWVGTFSGGLHRFDRNTETFKGFQHDPHDASSISGNRICSIFPDLEGSLWIGTDAGLDRYNPINDSFEHYLHQPDDPASISRGLVSSIYQDQKGQLWIGTEGGLNLLLKEERKFKHYHHDPTDASSLAEDYVKAIYEDKYGNLWLGTWGGGLDKFDARAGTFRHFQHAQSSPWVLSNNSVLALAGDHENLIYIATEGGGLNVFDIQREKFTQHLPDFTSSRSINSNSVHTLYYDDENGMLWAGTYNGGVNYFSKWDKPFMLHQARIYGLNNNHVTSIAEDQQGRLWIGTDGGGINIMDKQTGVYSYIGKADGRQDGLQSNAILSILCDSRNTIWIGTYNGGLDVIQSPGSKIIHYANNPEDPTSLSGKNISVIYEDKRGNIWAGSMFGGLNLFDRRTQRFTVYKNDPADPSTIVDNFIYGIYEDRLGRLLVQTGKGLEIFDYKTGRFERFNPKLTTNFGVPVTLLEDSQGNIWVGSQENGLFRVDRTGVKVNRYTTEDGLPSNSISGILEDESGNLWISTQRGLCKFEEAVVTPERIKFHIYSIEDGLQGSEFKRGAFCKTKDGRMVFGGQNGFNVFEPLKIKVNPFVPPVEITGFKIFNKEVDFRKGEILGVPISETNAIRLRHAQSVFTFDFSALSYMLAEKNQYAYMMEGFEETWNYVGTQRSATYSNLDAGEYYFNVKAANNDGIWNDTGTRIKITIIPPWWENLYFKLGLILLVLGAVLTYFRLRTYQLKRSKRALEQRVALSTADLKKATAIIEERQKEIISQNEILIGKNNKLEAQSAEMKEMAEEIKELTEAKIKFFANISHELHTPLNTILHESKEIAQRNDVPETIAEQHSLIYHNAKRLFKLINQLFDHREGAPVSGDRPNADLSVDVNTYMDETEGVIDGKMPAAFILIIEHDPEGSESKYTKLQAAYQMEYATNGADGLRMATELVPDLILCNAHLPDMDGLSLCERLKKDERSSHIPIIVMTTRTGDEHQAQAMEQGADDYITTPFQPDLLELKIKNIFFTRQKLKEMFLQGALTMPEQFNMSAVDKQFLKNAVKAVRDNMQNSGFGVDEFSGYFGMSRRNVLRKMKGVTGLSINEYIRNTRLKEAYVMLTKGERNVSEVAYAVGFTDPKYFSNCFKKLFGKLPSEVRTVANTQS